MATQWTELEKTSNKNTEWGNMTVSIGESTGITNANVDYKTFIMKVVAAGEHVFTYETTGEDNWYYNSEVVELSEYGIELTGTPVTGDQITIKFNDVSDEKYASEKLVKDYIDRVEFELGERISNLGFKTGSVTLAENVTATRNELKRQGNVVLIDLKYTVNKAASVYYGQIIGTIPEGFRPKEDIVLPLAKQIDVTTTIRGLGQETSITTKLTGTCTLCSTGEIHLLGGGSSLTDMFIVESAYPKTLDIKTGYEVEPLS